MAAGDLITTNYQYEFCGLLMGSGTKFITESWTGLFEIPNVKAIDLDRNDRHGVVPGPDLMGGRVIQGAVKILSTPGQVDIDFQNLMVSMRPKQVEFPFVYQRPLMGKRFTNLRPRKVGMPSDALLATGLGVVNVEFFGSDPRHFGLTQRAVTGSIPSGQTSSTLSTATNLGTWTTEPIITINGPADNIRLTVNGQTPMDTLVDNGRTIGIDCTLSTGDQLVIDVGKRTVVLNGTKAYNLKRTDNQWWSLFPGSNLITFARSSAAMGAPASIVVTWYDAFIY